MGVKFLVHYAIKNLLLNAACLFGQKPVNRCAIFDGSALMHKFLLFTFLLCAYGPITAQKTFIENGKLNGIMPVNDKNEPYYIVVKTVEATPKGELFKRARKWFVKSYNSARNVLDLNDPTTGELTAKGFFNIPVSVMGTTTHADVQHLLSIEVKDNKYRIIVTGLLYEPTNTPMGNIPMGGKKMINSVIENTNTQVLASIASLEKALSNADDF